ncbi:hypothetical protein Golob_025889, partial [Gossypium lobatum]|nr:hypothetical protein [Gossypium lobatum]
GLIEQVTRLSIFAKYSNNDDHYKKKSSTESKSNISSANLMRLVKSESTKTESSQPIMLNPTLENQNIKRKE